MRIEQLYYLIELSKTGSISRVANRNYISHQGISKSLLQLESEYGVQLFNRTSKGINLTPTGDEFVKCAQEIIERVEKLNKFKPKQLPPQPSLKGSISISVINLINKTTMPKIAADFCKRHPQVNLQIIEKNPLEIINDVENSTADLGLLTNINGSWDISAHISSRINQLTFEILSEERLLILVGKTHHLAAKKVLSIKEIMKQPFTIFEYAIFFNSYFASHGNLKIIHKANTLEITCKLISEGITIGYGAETLLDYPLMINGLVSIPIKENPKIITGFLLPKNKIQSPIVREFINVLKTYY